MPISKDEFGKGRTSDTTKALLEALHKNTLLHKNSGCCTKNLDDK